MRLNVITPCSRPVYLPIIARQLKTFTKLTLRWHIGYDANLSGSRTGTAFGHDFHALLQNDFPNLITSFWHRHPSTPSYNGTGMRNEAQERITDGDEWVAFLDDDTLLPPNYEDVVTETIRENPEADGFVFQQIDKFGNLRMDVKPEICRSYVFNLYDFPGHNGEEGCDTGQMLFKRKLIGNIKWRKQMSADREFYNDVVFNSCNQSRVRWVKKVASIHNALRDR